MRPKLNLRASPPAYDLIFVSLLVTLRTLYFKKIVLSSFILFSPTTLAEQIAYSTVALDLARGDYFLPIIHGYGIPGPLFWLMGKFIALFQSQVVGIGTFNFVVDSFVVVLTYLLGRVLFDRHVALLASFFVTISRTYLDSASIVIVTTATFHAAAFLLLFLALTRHRFMLSLLAGCLFGLPDGGGRFTPFLLLAAMGTTALWPDRRSMKVRHVLLLGVGFTVSLLPIIVHSLQHPDFLGSLFNAFTGGGFSHVTMPRPFFADIPSKLFEFFYPFFLYNPLCAIPLLVACIHALLRLLGGGRSFGKPERFVWSLMGILAFFLTFVMTYVEPGLVGGLMVRPFRYFFVLTPLPELVSAFTLILLLRPTCNRFAAGFHKTVVRSLPLLLLSLLVLYGLSLPHADERNPSLFEEMGIQGEATVLANTLPSSSSRFLKGNRFAFDYETYRREFPRSASSLQALPVEFYSIQTYKDPFYLLYEYQGAPIHLAYYFLNMPAFSFRTIAEKGRPIGERVDLYLHYVSKKRMRKTQRRYMEWQFSDVLAAQQEDWALLQAFNPDVRWEDYLIRQDEDEVILHIPIEKVAYPSLKLRFGRRDRIDPASDFTVPCSLTYLDVLGFGWNTSINLMDPMDWLAKASGVTIRSGVLFCPTAENEFHIRTVPGTYDFTIEWEPSSDAGAPSFLFNAEQKRPVEEVSLPNGHTESTFRIRTGDLLSVGFSSPGRFFLHRMELAPPE